VIEYLRRRIQASSSPVPASGRSSWYRDRVTPFFPETPRHGDLWAWGQSNPSGSKAAIRCRAPGAIHFRFWSTRPSPRRTHHARLSRTTRIIPEVDGYRTAADVALPCQRLAHRAAFPRYQPNAAHRGSRSLIAPMQETVTRLVSDPLGSA
jgi:hypothetical protein